MTTDVDEFEDPPPSYLARIAVCALALLGVATILSAALQIVGTAYGALPLFAAKENHVLVAEHADRHALAPGADEIEVTEYR